MKNLVLFTFVLSLSVFVSTSAFAQYTLTVEITGLKSNNGQVILEFCNAKGEKLSGIFKPVKDNKCIIEIKDLNPGSYSFKYFHDENMNKELDKNWIGMPKEGFGFSNNAKIKMGPPDLIDTVFEIKGNKNTSCNATYF